MFCAMCPAYHECVLHKPHVEYLQVSKNTLVMFYICIRTEL